MNMFDNIAIHTDAGRCAAYALREMGLRAVVAAEGLRLVGENVSPYVTPRGRYTTRVAQPRNERGRFVPYWLLSFEIEDGLSYIDWENGPWWEQRSDWS